MKIFAKSVLDDNIRYRKKMLESLGIPKDQCGLEILLKPHTLKEDERNNYELLNLASSLFDGRVNLETGDRLRDGVSVDVISRFDDVRDESSAYVNHVIEARKTLDLKGIVNFHLSGDGVMVKSGDRHPEVEPKDVCLRKIKDYLLSLDPYKEFIRLENTFPLDYQGNGHIFYYSFGKNMDDFVKIDWPMTFDTAHSTTTCNILGMVAMQNGHPFLNTDYGILPVYYGEDEKLVGERVLKNGIYNTVVEEFNKVKDIVRGVHLADAFGINSDCDNFIGAFEIGLLNLENVLSLISSAEYVVPEVKEDDYMLVPNQQRVIEQVYIFFNPTNL